jgi:hypothetical protein
MKFKFNWVPYVLADSPVWDAVKFIMICCMTTINCYLYTAVFPFVCLVLFYFAFCLQDW